MIVLVTRDFRRQFCAMLPGAIIMFITGLWSSWGSFEQRLQLNDGFEKILSVIAFYLGLIPGFFVGAYKMYRYNLLNMNHTNSSVLIILPIFYLAFPKWTWFLVPMRVIIGIMCGINHLFFVNYAADITSPKNRGKIIFFLRISYCFGYFIISWCDFKKAHYVVGALTIIFGAVAAYVGYKNIKRSAIFSLEVNDLGSAAKAIHYFNENVEKVFVEVQDLRRIWLNFYSEPYKFFDRQNWKTVAIIFLTILSNVLISNQMFLNSRSSVVHKEFKMQFSTSILLGCRMIGAVIGYFLLDLQSRRFWYTFSSLTISIVFIIAGIYLGYKNIVPTIMIAVMYLFIEFLYGAGMMALPDILCAEILPHKEKRFSMAFLYTIEASLKIVLTISSLLTIREFTADVLHSMLGVLLICFAAFIYSNLRDSRTKTPFEASLMYRVPE